MATTTGLLTVEQARALPDPKGGYYELHHGALVFMTRAKFKHWALQRRLTKLLEAVAKPDSVVGYEFAFRPLREHEIWCADVAYIAPERSARMDPDDNLLGAPDLVVEVLSPSNTVQEIDEKESMCLDNGTQEFWVVDPKRESIKVSTPDRRTVTYRDGEEIPLPLFGNAKLAVADVFRGIV